MEGKVQQGKPIELTTSFPPGSSAMFRQESARPCAGKARTAAARKSKMRTFMGTPVIHESPYAAKSNSRLRNLSISFETALFRTASHVSPSEARGWGQTIHELRRTR